MDTDIQFGNVEEKPPLVQLRPDRNRHYAAVPVYDPAADDLPIFIDVDVLREMESHACSDLHVELGGVLLGGQYTDEEGKPFVVITDSLRARHYESTRGSFKFTHETWEQITRERESFPSELQMVGWYHTHPDWGVFLSSLDMFICDHFFNKPLDVALVIDPCRQDRGFFQWTGESATRIRRTDGFYLIGSRFRAAELQSYAAQLEGSTNMAPNPHAANSPYPLPVIQLSPPAAPTWQVFAVLGMLSLQFCLLVLLVWQLSTRSESGSMMTASRAGELLEAQRQAELDAKLDVLELVVRQGTEAPQGVLRSLAEEKAEAAELRTSLRGQQTLVRELDGKIQKLEELLAASQRREQSQELELAKVQEKLSKVGDELKSARAELQESRKQPGATLAENDSWWSLLRANFKPISIGVVLGAVASGLVFAAVQHSPRSESASETEAADTREAASTE